MAEIRMQRLPYEPAVLIPQMKDGCLELYSPQQLQVLPNSEVEIDTRWWLTWPSNIIVSVELITSPGAARAPPVFIWEWGTLVLVNSGDTEWTLFRGDLVARLRVLSWLPIMPCLYSPP